MKVSIGWLKELVEINIPLEEVIGLINLRTIGTKEVTDKFIELDMKGHHRSDLLSMRGVALEVAAVTGSAIRFEDKVPTLRTDLPKVKNQIDDSKLCPFYSLVKIEGLKVGPSPEDWVRKLADCGMRSVNNIADVTNLVMLEFGQPLHSFDAAEVCGEKIIVRRARAGEELETLDGKIRKLEPTDLLITDSEKALGLAGVMGGKNSEITDSTTSILLEAAIFDPQNLRETSQRLGLLSEASKRFYHGLTKQRLFQALEKAISLYEELGGGVTALSVEDNLEENKVQIELTKEKTDSLIGVEITREEIEGYLKRLNFSLENKGVATWLVTPPIYRLDITIEEDLIEEVARLFGYENIPSKELSGEKPKKIDQRIFETIYKLKETLAGEGLTEIQTYSFYSTEVLENMGWAPDHLDALVKIANPISSETKYLRMVIWQNLLEVVAKNFKQGYQDIAIFEVGKMYGLLPDKKIDEDYDLAIALMNGTDNPVEELFTIVKKATERLGITIELGDQKMGPIEEMLFHPNRFQHLLINGKGGGGLAEVHPRIVNKFGLDKRVAIAEIPLKTLKNNH